MVYQITYRFDDLVSEASETIYRKKEAVDRFFVLVRQWPLYVVLAQDKTTLLAEFRCFAKSSEYSALRGAAHVRDGT